MGLALRLARLGAGWTHPNPRVGAVAVRAGRVVATGAHLACGAEHAEAGLVRRTPPRELRGATLYVTLEPCSHHGKTPPCAPVVGAAGFERVVVAMADPHPLVDGRGLRHLAATGVTVEVGCEEAEAARLNAPFLWMLLRGRAFVTLKVAASLDGRVAAADGTSQWISGEASRRLVHQWRAQCDAILVGRGTMEADLPRLTARPARDPLAGLRRRAAGWLPPSAPGGHRWPHQPLRIVLDSDAVIARRPALLDHMVSAPGGRWVIACDERAPHSSRRRLERAGIGCWVFPTRGGARGVNLRALATGLAEEGRPDLFVEGGPTLSTELVKDDLVDRYRVCTSPVLLGGHRNWLGGIGFRTLDEGPRLVPESLRRCGPDVLITALSGSAAHTLGGGWKVAGIRGRTDRETCPPLPVEEASGD